MLYYESYGFEFLLCFQVEAPEETAEAGSSHDALQNYQVHSVVKKWLEGQPIVRAIDWWSKFGISISIFIYICMSSVEDSFKRYIWIVK